ncbi:hypothetical protein [uncultured Chryseobacterium sp.]|uniref:hypothetical protein n=1 Tax=uncultured Chryseobacterium sp. TaxID=259322 RepID=UPI00258C56F9|nr:hypothetical protein [uncultured Chryseobacterium sp.]
MKNSIIKREIIELVKKDFISNLPFNSDRKQFIKDNIYVEDLEKYFSELTDPEELKGIKIDNSSFESMQDYLIFSINYMKLNIVALMLNAAVKLKLISEDMTFDEKINYLIDLKNLDEANILQQVIADTLEHKINNPSELG